MTTPLQDLRAAVEGAAASLANGQGVPSARLTLDRPPRADLGDYSTNAALLLAPVLKAPKIIQKKGNAATIPPIARAM